MHERVREEKLNMRNGKTELVNKIVEVAGREGVKITKKDTAQLLKTLQTSVEELLQDAGDTVDLQGFVKFEKYETPEREFYNIATKTVETSVPSIKIKAKSKLKAQALVNVKVEGNQFCCPRFCFIFKKNGGNYMQEKSILRVESHITGVVMRMDSISDKYAGRPEKQWDIKDIEDFRRYSEILRNLSMFINNVIVQDQQVIE